MSRTLTLISPDGKKATLEILLVGGDALAIAAAWNWTDNKPVLGLYRIYLVRDGAAIGPFYSTLVQAADGMKKLRKAWPDHIWIQPMEWLQRQSKLADWVIKELGKPEDLVGGTWVEPADWPPVQKRRTRGES